MVWQRTIRAPGLIFDSAPKEDLFEAIHRQLPAKKHAQLKIRIVFIAAKSNLPFLIREGR